MATCPTCTAVVADSADACPRCGAFVVGQPVMLTVALTPENGPGVARLDSRFPAPGTFPTHAPAPLVEPIRPPVTPTPDRPAPTTVRTGMVPLFEPTPAPGGLAPTPHVVAAGPPAAVPQPGYRLRVIRGHRVNVEYPVYPGRNVVGRFADKPVDIDLTGLEPEGQVWSSRQHAAVTLDRGMLVVEDLNSLNGTWVNGARIRAGAALPLKPGDVLQIGVAQLRVVADDGTAG
jgi:hypothetical protein